MAPAIDLNVQNLWFDFKLELLPATDVVDGLIVDHERAVGVLQGGVGRQDGVVGLHHGRSNLQLWTESKCAADRKL